MPQKCILLVEDGVQYLVHWKRELEDDGYEVFCAENIPDALALFPTKQWAAIAVDGCIGGDEFNSPPLIKKFKAESQPGCPIIAASRSEELREMMVAAGCTHEARKKDHVPGLIDHILKRQ